MDLDAVADELYAATPEDFMALRTQRVADAKDDGDKALAKEIGTLRRPTRSGWLVNLLARRAPEELQSLIELGGALRAAQEQLSGPDLRRLSAERHQAVDALARRAAGLATAEGQSATEAVRQEVAGTLQAALADPTAAEVVLAGRVVSAIRYGGFGTIDLGGAPTVTRAAPAKAAPRRPKAGQDDAEARAAEAHQAAISEAEATLAALTETLDATEKARVAAETGETEAAVDRADAQQHVDDLRSELQQAEERLIATQTEQAAAEDVAERARSARDQARRDHTGASAALDRLRDG